MGSATPHPDQAPLPIEEGRAVTGVLITACQVPTLTPSLTPTLTLSLVLARTLTLSLILTRTLTSYPGP